MMRSRQDFIKKHSDLFWYTPEQAKRNIGDDLLAEAMLNHGTLDA